MPNVKIRHDFPHHLRNKSGDDHSSKLRDWCKSSSTKTKCKLATKENSKKTFKYRCKTTRIAGGLQKTTERKSNSNSNAVCVMSAEELLHSSTLNHLHVTYSYREAHIIIIIIIKFL